MSGITSLAAAPSASHPLMEQPQVEPKETRVAKSILKRAVSSSSRSRKHVSFEKPRFITNIEILFNGFEHYYMMQNPDTSLTKEEETIQIMSRFIQYLYTIDTPTEKHIQNIFALYPNFYNLLTALLEADQKLYTILHDLKFLMIKWVGPIAVRNEEPFLSNKMFYLQIEDICPEVAIRYNKEVLPELNLQISWSEFGPKLNYQQHSRTLLHFLIQFLEGEGGRLINKERIKTLYTYALIAVHNDFVEMVPAYLNQQFSVPFDQELAAENLGKLKALGDC